MTPARAHFAGSLTRFRLSVASCHLRCSAVLDHTLRAVQSLNTAALRILDEPEIKAFRALRCHGSAWAHEVAMCLTQEQLLASRKLVFMLACDLLPRCVGKAHRRARSSSSSARRSSARSCCARSAATSRSRSAAAAAAASAAAWRQLTKLRGRCLVSAVLDQRTTDNYESSSGSPVILHVYGCLAPAHAATGGAERAWSRASRSACHAAMRRCSVAAAARSAALRPSCSALLATTCVSLEGQSTHANDTCNIGVLASYPGNVARLASR